MGEYHEHTVCGACGERAVRLHRAISGVNEDGEPHESSIETARVPKCGACAHVPSEQVYRENRLDDLLPPREDWPDDSGVVYSENLPLDRAEQEEAICLVLGPHEWRSLRERTALEFQHDGVGVSVLKGKGPGATVHTGEGQVGGIEVHITGPVLKELHQTGRWSGSVGPALYPLHLAVIVHTDA